MSPNSNGSKRPQLMAVWEVEYWANIPIETIEHFMSPGMDEWLQVYWTIVRCGPCHPHQSPVAMRPRLKKGGFQGWVKKLQERIAKKLPVRQGDLNDELIDCDDDGVPLCLTQRDLCVILGKTPNNVNRALVGGVEKGLVVLSTENNGESVRRGCLQAPQRGLRPIPKPTVVLPVAKNTKNFVIADVVLSTESLPIDPVLRTAAIGWLARLGTDWRKDLKGLRTDYRKRLREGCTEYGILISSPEVPGSREDSGSVGGLGKSTGHSNGSSSSSTFKLEKQNRHAAPAPVPLDNSNQKSTTTTTKPPMDGVEYASPRDELVALIESTTGRRAEKRTVRDICDTLEARGGTLPEYLADIKPRLSRLRTAAQEGFYIRHAQQWGTAANDPAPAPQTKAQATASSGRCPLCKGVGKTATGYCSCAMGKDLHRDQKRQAAREAAAGD